ncbi:GNAT family N-acetyltransferase [Chitinophaga solisilvae]|uniref:GNAT family N-acetyltransferase n=1 Tax=Chitinophaga solisilvae TaxID=1233460 RepID=A0A3S1D3R3_9BACT|nr:GNAT family N-acetyltransferase [Chitinophaga solisilvae]NSL87750.1 GNAT family N-acetyltransferase [Chitinophaga solisilvae]
MEIFVRKATIADLEVLLAFEQGIVAAERPYDSTLKEGNIHYYDIAEMIAAEDTEVAVAVAGEEIIGSGYARLENAKHYRKHLQHAYLGFMFVRPEFRGRGVNTLILAALKEWAYLKGVTELCLDVYHNNEAAVKAYLKAGFKPSLLEMRLSLNDDPTWLAQ